jgi:GT2 family glycosyltransferase
MARSDVTLDPLVSVVIPTRNRAGLLAGALESVASQSHRPLEVIVVDDGSTDETAQVFEAWRLQQSRDRRLTVRMVRSDEVGANAARNLGCEEATGELVAFLDSDDRWDRRKVACQVQRLNERPQAAGVYCGVQNRRLDTGEVASPPPRSYPEGDLLRQLLVCDVTAPTSCWLLRLACLEEVGGFDERLPARQDWDLWIRLAEKYKIVAVPQVLVDEGQHPGERIRSNPTRELLAHRMIFQKHRSTRKSLPLSVTLAAQSAMFRRRGRVMFHHGLSWPRAFSWGIAAVAVWPFDFDSYAFLAGMLLPGAVRRPLHRGWNRVFGATPFSIRSH